MPLVSVLTSAYAPSGHYLREAMTSVLSQQLPDGWELEWVVQEDGPDPSLREKVAGDDRVSYAANESALGIAPTRNLALSRVRGEFVQVLDHDDVLLPGALATLLAVMEDRSLHWAVGQADDLMTD